MKFGVAFPLNPDNDTGALRDFAQTLDGAGFDFVTVGGHLLSSEAGRFPDRPNMTYAGPFYEPMVVFAYLAAVTQRLRFRTSILILPIFPTALIARQAAELSILSGGRFELGVGISWNAAEYQAMGQDFTVRGRRLEEQVTLLRRYWTEPLVSFTGRWDQVDRMGLSTRLPGPIPIWIGASNEEAPLRRAARLADGWLPLGDPAAAAPRLLQYLAEAGRDPAAFGIGGRLTAGAGEPDTWVTEAQRLLAVGVTDLTIGAPPELSGTQALARIVEAKQALAAALPA